VGEAKRRSDAWKKYALTGEKPDEVITTARPKSRHLRPRETDIADPLREHRLDPEHIREELEVQRIAREEGIEHLMGNEPDEKEKHRLVPPLEDDVENRRVTQEFIDATRMRAATFIMDAYLRKGENLVPVKHLWFPEDDTAAYELREGNAPANHDRPAHLQDLNLDIDIGFIPPDVAEALWETQVAKMGASTTEDLEKTGLWLPHE